MNALSSTLQIPTASVLEPLLVPSRYKAIYGGRGSLKSHFFSELACDYAVYKRGFRMVCVREVQKSLKDSAKRLIEDKIDQMRLTGFRILHDRIETPGDGVILFQGMQDHTAESIKSLEGFDVAWSEEAQTTSSRSLEFLRPTIRKDGSELWFSWNPRNTSDPVDKFFRGLNPPDNAIIVRTNYTDNPWWPEALEEERLHDLKFNRDRYAHVWEGEYEPIALGAIWNRQTIHSHRLSECPSLERIVVAVDPAISSEEDSNEHGIVVLAIGADQRGYVLEDASMKGNPEDWARRAVAMFDKWAADSVVIEINQGGDMVKHTLRTIRPTLPVTEVRATRGKHVRAEPIASLYSLGRVSHVGTFDELEDQMCKMTAGGYEGNGSPDRVDAMVWGFTQLFPGMTRPKPDPGPLVIPSNKPNFPQIRRIQ